MDLRVELMAEMTGLKTVDCHSHTVLEREYRKLAPLSLFSMGSYFERDIQSVQHHLGGGGLYDGCRSDAARWQRLKGVLDKARNVSYWRHNIVTFQALFGLEDGDLTDENWQAVNEQMKLKTAGADWYRHVTEDVCGLQTQVRNIPWFEDWEPQYFTAILRMEPALGLWRDDVRKSLERHLDVAITDLWSCRDALGRLVEEYRARGAVGIKLAHAYSRTLLSEPVSTVAAGNILDKALQGESLTREEIKQFEDHVIFFLAGLCTDMNLIFDIHTGVQGNWGHVPDSNPLHLLPLIHAHRGTRFNLYHAGYPYSREIGILGKHCPNVWLNMAWMYVITMEGSRQSLSEWIDLVPGFRLLGFGSDVRWPELIYG
ncbi:MAG: amidohydrolase family protein, partial [Armatimonadetes bacterium]|nr:amidohydrolase family protein [Armatimonadota bacterium]